MKPSTLFFVSCHPWCGRHGAHLYDKLNKPWLPVIFTLQELEFLGCKESCPTKHFDDPQRYYESFFKELGLKIESADPIVDFIETLSQRHDYAIIKRRMERALGQNYLEKVQLTWIDYVLKVV